MVNADLKRERMTQDAAMICSPWDWPQNPLHLKTQPWVAPKQFATLNAETPLVVHVKGGGIENYTSMDALVAKWSVD